MECRDRDRRLALSHPSDSERELLASAKFREMLLAIVGHDLRNPLVAIIMSASTLHMQSDLGASNVAVVGRISRSALSVTRVIEELLDFTRVRVDGELVHDSTFDRRFHAGGRSPWSSPEATHSLEYYPRSSDYIAPSRHSDAPSVRK